MILVQKIETRWK